jgi:tetratricopeptide (TPR) repeat protein
LQFDASQLHNLFVNIKKQENQEKLTITMMIQEIIKISNQKSVRHFKKETISSALTQELKNFDEKARLSFDTGDYLTALKTFQYIEESKNLTYNQRCMKGDCLVRLFRKEEAQILINEALEEDPYNVNMIYVQSLLHYYDLNLDECKLTSVKVIDLDQLFMVAKDIRNLAFSMTKHFTAGKAVLTYALHFILIEPWFYR